MKQLCEIELESDPIKLGGLEPRLLQFADDVALIARSEEDLDRLLSGFEKYSDTSHQITSVKKTETVIVSFQGDDLKFHNFGPDPSTPEGPDRYMFWDGQHNHVPFQFLYKQNWLKSCDFFVYLGVYFHWRQEGSAASEYRPEKGRKVFGAVSGQL